MDPYEIDEDGKHVCLTCGAVVDQYRTDKHQDWHNKLEAQMARINIRALGF